jgi:alpha-galactosidase
MHTSTTFRQVASVPVDLASGTIYELGWQSWSPSSVYPVTATSGRPANEFFRIFYRPETPSPERGFQAEGMLAVQPSADAGVRVFVARDGRREVPSIRATLHGTELVVEADGDVLEEDYPGLTMHEALAATAEAYASRNITRTLRPVPAIWASWYQYFTKFTQADLDLNLDWMERLDLPVGIVRLDDAFQAGIGDWLEVSDQFGSLDGMVKSVLDRGRSAGAWSAPFLVGERSKLLAEHPDWVVRDTDGAPIVAHHNWNQLCYVLDTTNPGAQEYLHRVFTTYKAWGVDYFMVDFVYGGAMAGIRYEHVSGVQAYTTGMQIIRDAIGEESWLQGCGAPMLPSVGFVDTMRVGADIAPEYAAHKDELANPGGETAIISTIGRAFTQGRWWINDPDCFVVRPGIERREQWADVVEHYGGVRISSDGLDQLDEWGLEQTRALLQPARTTPFDLTLPLTSDAVKAALVGRDVVGRPGGQGIYDEIAASR